MAQGQEYLTSNANIAYPFREDAPGILSGLIPKDWFVDALLIVEPDIETVYLDRAWYIGGHLYMVFVDSSGNTVWSGHTQWAVGSSTTLYKELDLLPSGDYLTLIRLVVRCSVMDNVVSTMVGTQNYSQNLPLEACTVEPRPRKVLTFDLYTDPTGLPEPPEPDVPGTINADVKLLSGYNIDQYVEAPPSAITDAEIPPDTATITLSVVPGAGEGLYPCDPPDTPDPGASDGRMKMAIRPDESGNINLEPGPEECYSIIPIPLSGQIQIQGGCEACCNCEDFDRVGKALQNLLTRSKAILTTLNEARGYYESGVTHFNSTVSPIYHSLYMQLNGAAGPLPADDNIRSHAVNWANVIAGVRNNLPNAVQPYRYELTIQTPDGARVRHAAWEYDSQGDDIRHNMLAADLLKEGVPQIQPGKSIYFTFRLYADYFDALSARALCESEKYWLVSMTLWAYDLKTGTAETIEVTDEVLFG